MSVKTEITQEYQSLMNISPADFQSLFENFIKNLQRTEKPLVVTSQIEDKVDEMKIVKPLRKKKQPKRKLSDISPSGASLNFVSIPDLVYSDDLAIALKNILNFFQQTETKFVRNYKLQPTLITKKLEKVLLVF